MLNMEFYRGKKVFITGHTGFKGGWLSYILLQAGAKVVGYALEPDTENSLFGLSDLANDLESHIGDVRDFDRLHNVIDGFRPDIVIHLAAQPLVLNSYDDPKYTYEVNVMGTVNVLECARSMDSLESILNVTTDKVYENNEWVWGYRENDPLNGFDPYSNSKSCSDILTSCYSRSFFAKNGIGLSVARAGNVIGGGDFAENRILPDCVKAAISEKCIEVRNPLSVRPYQHVFEPLFAYLMIAEAQAKDPGKAQAYNVGPEEADCVSTEELVGMFCAKWGDGLEWRSSFHDDAPHEANILKLDSSRIKDALGWQPVYTVSEAVSDVVDWAKAWKEGRNIRQEMDKQLSRYGDRKNEKSNS